MTVQETIARPADRVRSVVDRRIRQVRPAVRRAGEPLAIYGGSRIGILSTVWILSRVLPPLTPGGVLASWDGEWYSALAEHGYPAHVPKVGGVASKSVIAFFPVYPFLVRLVRGVTGLSVQHAGLLVSFLCGAAMAVVLSMLVERLYGELAARRAVVLTCFFPGSLALSLMYSEATLLLAVVVGLYFLVERRWVLAGLAGAVATATRPNGAAFTIAALVVAVLAARRASGGWERWRPFLAPVLSGTGIVAFFAYLWWRTGEKDAWFQVERHGWGDYLDPGARWGEIHEFIRRPWYQTANVVLVLGLVFVVVGLVFLWRARLHVALSAYALASLATSLAAHDIGARPRFLLVAFPLFIAMALRLRTTAFTVTAATFGSLLAAYTFLITAGRFATP